MAVGRLISAEKICWKSAELIFKRIKLAGEFSEVGDGFGEDFDEAVDVFVGVEAAEAETDRGAGMLVIKAEGPDDR